MRLIAKHTGAIMRRDLGTIAVALVLSLLLTATIGAQDDLLCSNCGFENPAGNKFCNNCGANLSTGKGGRVDGIHEALVLSKKSKNMAQLDLGSRDGIYVGQGFEIVQESGRIYHPESGELLSIEFEVLGGVIVEEVQEKTCLIEVIRMGPQLVLSEGLELRLRSANGIRRLRPKQNYLGLSFVFAAALTSDKSENWRWEWEYGLDSSSTETQREYGFAILLGLGKRFSLQPTLLFIDQELSMGHRSTHHDHWYPSSDFGYSATRTHVSLGVLLRYEFGDRSPLAVFLETGILHAHEIELITVISGAGLRWRLARGFAVSMSAGAFWRFQSDSEGDTPISIKLKIAPEVRLFRF